MPKKKKTTKKLRFRDLEIGDRFEFVPDASTRYSGLARGPWFKVSARIYKHESDKRLNKVKIGTIDCEVTKLSPACKISPDFACAIRCALADLIWAVGQTLADNPKQSFRELFAQAKAHGVDVSDYQKEFDEYHGG